MWLTIERRSASARSSGGEPWKVQPSWNAAPPAGTSIGTSSSSVSGGIDARTWASQSSGAWKSPPSRACGQWVGPVVGRGKVAAEPRVRPVVRALDVVDRAGVRARVVERHPARRHVGRVEVVEVGGVLVAEQRLARRRLPDEVVLGEPQTRHAGELRAELRVALREDR